MANDNQITVKKRLIYAEDLFEPVDFKVFYVGGRSGGKTMAMFEQLFRKRVEMAPTIDAEPVVRCKDCRFGIPEEDTIIPNCHKCVEGADLDEETGEYYGFTSYHSGDFYCAFGERRE